LADRAAVTFAVARLAFVVGLLSAATTSAAPPQPPATAAPVEDGNWTMPGKNAASTRFSGLNELNSQNVGRLRVEFTFSTGVLRGHEAAPIVQGDTMYLITPYPNRVYALDLAKAGAPQKWRYDPKPVAAAQGIACCDVVNRGVTIAGNSIYLTTLDGQAISLQAATGKERWRKQLGNINKGETITMAPFVAGDKVVVGNSGGEYGVRGWIIALDANTGDESWRAYSTGPDTDVLIGPRFAPFYDSDRGKDLGLRTWPPEAWKIGGGTMWGWISYDPELQLIYHGTANPGPWNPEQRPGDNKWTGGIFARDLATGEARWFYQAVPHDLYDYDSVNEIVLLDMQFNGQLRKVLVRPERNGYMYIIDRISGEVLAADAYAHVNSITSVDLKTGRPTHNSDKKPQLGKVVRDICPAAPGAKDWNPSAYSPMTGLLYVPHLNLCMNWESLEANYISGTPYVGANVVMHAGPGGNRGELLAWDIAQRKPAWKIKEDLPLWSGALATAGNLVFYGTLDGVFKAVDATTGELKWQFQTGSGIVGQPVTYRGPDGHQYVAVLAGVGGWAGAIVAGDLDARDPTAATGFANAVSDLPQRTAKGGMLYVFSLPR
jgi:PQQ-dependent dehydrogenase (methanol/ethanol family)